jgi:Ca-activated chloride channel family protein
MSLAGFALFSVASFCLNVLASKADTTAARWERYTYIAVLVAGVILFLVGGGWWRKRLKAAERELPERDEGPELEAPKQPWTWQRVARGAWPWAMTAALGAVVVIVASAVFDVPISRMTAELRHVVHLALHPGDTTGDVQQVEWKSPRAVFLVAGGALVALVGFHLQRRRTATMGFSQVKLIGSRGVGAALSSLPIALRVLSISALAIGLGRPETYRTVKRQIDSVDIVIVMDMSKSMEETDMPRDRMDAAQRVIRRFLRRNKNDRIGLVIFGQQAMLQCPLTHDSKILEKIVADLVIGDVPELGTAIGDGLALAVAQLRRSDAKSKVVILLSDGDSNWVTRFAPDEAAKIAKEQKIKVYTLLVGREESDLFGGMSVNPATLRNIASTTGGEFFRASDYASFDRGFQTVRNKLDTSKRTVTERIPDQQLFVPFALLGIALLMLELLLSHTRLRRLP